MTVLEICAGGGGQSLGLELAGFVHAGAVEIDADACLTLQRNRPQWNVIEGDIASVPGEDFTGVDLLAGGIPCPPFSIAGKQLGENDERDLFPQVLRLAREMRPPAVMIENVRGLATSRFVAYRERLLKQLDNLGYDCFWALLNASDFGVPQLRPRFLLVGLQPPFSHHFGWPEPLDSRRTVGAALADLMGSKGWAGAEQWAFEADSIAPTIVGGSKKHGGPDLGPTRARKQWETLRVDGLGIADHAPPPAFPLNGMPRLTTRMVARLQGFPDDWCFAGGKTSAYRQVGNAFPPPVAKAVGESIRAALEKGTAAEAHQLTLENLAPVSGG
ncbi:MAG: DNA cytosine methyltransferase [Dehalococcoidia bacterium]|nr:DNA cytosine methyltransferase [Dehalococcoidia bacterium]